MVQHSQPTDPQRWLSDEQLQESLQAANLPVLLMVLAQLTGDDRYLKAPYRPSRPRGLDDNSDGGFEIAMRDSIRAEALGILRKWREDGMVLPAPLAKSRFLEMMSVTLGEPVDAEHALMMAEQVGLPLADAPPEHHAVIGGQHHVVVVGAGMSGILAGILLKQAGVPFTILEKGKRLGGTWSENLYPGCGVDTPGHLYSYSFEPWSWSSYYPSQGEVLAYLEHCARKYQIVSSIRFDTELLEARWDDEVHRWKLRANQHDGSVETIAASVLISAVGQLNRPYIPPLQDLGSFAGPVFHTAEWDDSVELSGQRVAVVGTGASAMQLVPAIADRVEHLLVFQRSPQWASPNPNYRQKITPALDRLFKQMPFYHSWYRLRLFWMFNDKVHAAIQRDPDWPNPERAVNATNDRHRVALTQYIESELGEHSDMRDEVLPTYPPFGKRMLMDCGWYRTVVRPDVELITDGVARVEPQGLRTVDGAAHSADVLIFATGFDSLRLLAPIEIVGRSGRTLRDSWGDDDAAAYLGIAVADFPNMFCLYGPNTNPGHGGSVVFQAECQMHYILRLLEQMAQSDADAVEVTTDAQERYVAAVDSAHEQMIWTHQGMDTWYRNARGRVVTNSPWRFVEYWGLTREPRISDFHLSGQRHSARSVQAVEAP